MTVGTLQDQLLYPLQADSEHRIPVDQLRTLLRSVDLESLLDRSGGGEEVTNWGDILSLGEQQRLGMARLFFHKPRFAILDECTSGVTVEMEERFCRQVQDLGCTCITISHRPALMAFHDVVLNLDGEGGWSIHEGHRALVKARIGGGDGDEVYKMDDWLQLLGMFISDGSTNGSSVYISALKERKVKFNTEILNKLELEFTYNENHGIFGINKKKYPEIYEELDMLSVGALNKQLPNSVWDLSKRQCNILLEALLQGDGHTMKYKGEDEFSRYGTISIKLADDISRLATHCGYSGIVKIAEEPTGIVRIGKHNMGVRAGEAVSITQKHTYYKVSIIRKQNQPWINKKVNDSNVEQLIDYTGKVYCVEMPTSHLYYMRETKYSAALFVGNSSKHGQKGTCGNIIPECDMPFTKDGLRPDIIINPHAIPSRMTIGQLKETLLGKVLLELGMFGDGTSFGNLDIKTITEELQKLSYESYGNEILYNGLTGEQLETSIFIGPVFYQRLKHMVNDKVHSRATGPMVSLTHQPAEGRSRAGGLRIGEMERDVIISHGATRFCKERLFDVSDKYHVHVCKKCGMIAACNDGNNNNKFYTNSDFTIHLCKNCGNRTEFSLVDMPYANKLLFQELQTINIVPRIITEN